MQVFISEAVCVCNPYWLLKPLVKHDARQRTEEIDSSIWHARWLGHTGTGYRKECLDSISSSSEYSVKEDFYEVWKSNFPSCWGCTAAVSSQRFGSWVNDCQRANNCSCVGERDIDWHFVLSQEVLHKHFLLTLVHHREHDRVDKGR